MEGNIELPGAYTEHHGHTPAVANLEVHAVCQDEKNKCTRSADDVLFSFGAPSPVSHLPRRSWLIICTSVCRGVPNDGVLGTKKYPT